MLIRRTRTFSFFLFASILVSIQLSMTGMVSARIIRDMKFNFKLNNYVRDDPGFTKLPSVLLDRLHIPRRSSTLPVFQEAPTFRNGKECIVLTPSSRRSGYSQLQEEEDDDTDLCDSTTVHIAMTLDAAAYLRGLVAGIASGDFSILALHIISLWLRRIIYLDSYLVVVDDIAKLMHPRFMAWGLKKTRTTGSDGTTCYNRWQWDIIFIFLILLLWCHVATCQLKSRYQIPKFTSSSIHQ